MRCYRRRCFQIDFLTNARWPLIRTATSHRIDASSELSQKKSRIANVPELSISKDKRAHSTSQATQTSTGTNMRVTKTRVWLSTFLQRAHALNSLRQPIALEILKRIFWRTLRTQHQYLRRQVDQVVHREMSTLNP